MKQEEATTAAELGYNDLSDKILPFDQGVFFSGH